MEGPEGQSQDQPPGTESCNKEPEEEPQHQDSSILVTL
jgi:hypothetical protein